MWTSHLPRLGAFPLYCTQIWHMRKYTKRDSPESANLAYFQVSPPCPHMVQLSPTLGGGTLMKAAGLAVCLFLSTFRGVTINRESNEISRRDLSGRLLWSVRLAGDLDWVRPPQDHCDAERLYISHNDGVTALDMKTGKVLWHTKGPSDRLLLSGDLLLATDCSAGESVKTNGRWLTARATKSGAEVFKIRLATEEDNLQPIREITGLFLVQIMEHPGGKGNALLFDRQGQVRHRFDREIIDGRIQGEDRVFITSRDLVCLSPEGKTLWVAPFERKQWIAGGGLVYLPGDHLVAFLYGTINDSGVQVMRVDVSKGKVVWRASCAGLGVTHSIYEHQANVTLDEGQIKVNSEGSSGTFVEYLDLGTGRQLKRTTSER
jgi:outer membrane protein assembly factor BamB